MFKIISCTFIYNISKQLNSIPILNVEIFSHIIT